MRSQAASIRRDHLEDLLSRTGAKERVKIEKHLAACDAEAGGSRGQLFRRLASLLDSLSGAGLESVGGQAWRFFVPDGKYKMQVFALEDRGDGTLRVYAPDVLDEALANDVLVKTRVPNEFAIKGTRHVIRVETIDGSRQDPPAHVKSMLGWGRKAIEVILTSGTPSEAQVGAAESLCSLAAQRWG